jgi:hypothetical protein
LNLKYLRFVSLRGAFRHAGTDVSLSKKDGEHDSIHIGLSSAEYVFKHMLSPY